MVRGGIAVLMLLAGAAAADPNLPSTLRVVSQGRLTYFAGPKRVIWYAPFALSSSLDCGSSDDLARDRTCNLKILNALNDEDRSWIKYFRTEGLEREVEPIASPIVQRVEERFEKMDRRVPTRNTSLPQTLALSSDPYVNVRFWMFPGTERSLMTAYTDAGVGTFVSEAVIRAERNEDFLELRDTAPIREVIAQAREGLKLAELRERLSAAVLESKPVANNLRAEEAIGIAYRTLIGRHFRRTRAGIYELKPGTLELDEILLLVDESYEDREIRCRAELLLKKGALPSIKCEIEEES